METTMYCNQCEEAVNNKACTRKGVCGKNPSLANKLDELKEYLKEMAKTSNLTLENKRFVMHSMFKLITNASFNQSTIEESITYAKQQTNIFNLSPYYEQDVDLNAMKSLILSGLMGICAYHAHAIRLQQESLIIHDFVLATLSKINEMNSLEELIALSDEVGKHGVDVMELLSQANSDAFDHPVLSEVNLGVATNPGILISGHDLSDIEELLKQSEHSGVDIYTHCEMLPAHYYPKLKKFKHLVGNYGNAWWNQQSEFTSFQGPIVFTTNCIVPPKSNASYLDKIYSTNDCDHPGFQRVPIKADKTKDFSAIIAQAKTCSSPISLEEGTITGGFAHNQVLELADTIVENVKSGAIRKFVVMSGCDGRKAERSYYSDFAKALPNDTIILTSGCAKYRYNKLNLGSINGIPRVLDAGQCNDSYSLVVIALKLQEIFQLESINDLPISYNIAWYEQKAIIVLLAMLHMGIRNICVGPTLPSYLSEATTSFLMDHYGLQLKDTVEKDLNTLG